MKREAIFLSISTSWELIRGIFKGLVLTFPNLTLSIPISNLNLSIGLKL
jgi:hypothetical protein